MSSIKNLKLVLNRLTNSGRLSRRKSEELKKCVRKVDHFLSVKDQKSLAKEIDRFCRIILSDEL